MKLPKCFVLATLAYSVRAAAFKNRETDADSSSSPKPLGKIELWSKDEAAQESHDRRRRENGPPKATDGVKDLDKADALLVNKRPLVKPELHLAKNIEAQSSMWKLGTDMSGFEIPTVSKPKLDVYSKDDLEHLKNDLHAKPPGKGVEKIDPAHPGKGLFGMAQRIGYGTSELLGLEKIEKGGKS